MAVVRDALKATEPPSRLVLLGHPVAHSLSPRFQNAALTAAGMPQRYAALDVAPDSLGVTLDRLREENAGGNVTIPHKEAVAARCVRRSALADRVGAVNTFWFERGELVGHNTDVAGVTEAIVALFAERSHVAGSACALLGAGGSAAATLVALQQLGVADIRMHSRTPARCYALADRVGVHVSVWDSPRDAASDVTLVINATPIGLRDDEMPIDPTSLGRSVHVLDLVYRTGETAWVRACRARGLRAQDGLRMLVEQGAAAFESWFGIEPSRDAMWSALEPRG